MKTSVAVIQIICGTVLMTGAGVLAIMDNAFAFVFALIAVVMIVIGSISARESRKD